jgi:FkbM family methyltransferase
LISYAQNFEDVMLWRVFGQLPQGFYIDVGAGDPEELSVTRVFYESGWRGVNIEPNSERFARLSMVRKHDINLSVGLSDTIGERSFFLIKGNNDLATLREDIAELHRQAGWQVEKTQTRTTTLADVCQQYANGSDIHFLKIDVEGAEEAVLMGGDFTHFRPWVVLVEATLPNSTVEAFTDWEPILLRSDYRFAWFDGLNRFYIAEEHWEALSRHFRVPPNVFDNFRRAVDFSEEVRAAEAAAATIAAAMREAEEACRRATAAKVRASEQAVLAERKAREARAEANLARQREAERAAELEAKAAENQAAKTLLELTRASTSWRITAPMRATRWLLRGHVGAMLLELGMPGPRVERLRSVAGADGSTVKRASRVALYVSARAATRLPGSAHVTSLLEKCAPQHWFRRYADIALAAYIQDDPNQDNTNVQREEVLPLSDMTPRALHIYEYLNEIINGGKEKREPNAYCD